MERVKLGITEKNKVKDTDIPSDSDTSFKKIVDSEFDKLYGKDKIDTIVKRMHRMVTQDYGNITPHVNGYYFIHMIHGTWVNTIHDAAASNSNSDIKGGVFDSKYKKSNDMSDFKSISQNIERITEQFGQLATDIDIPQINIEYESISGKARNLNYASRIHFAGDFSINFLENYNNDVLRYHETWLKYIDALKKGYVIQPSGKINNSDATEFIDVPYFNAVWIVIFAPFSTNIRGLIKIMGVSPINLPIKQIIGDRSKSTLSTINQNYKSNDMIYRFYENEAELHRSPFFDDFIKQVGTSWGIGGITQ